MNEVNKDLLLKIKRLAEQGIGGEKTNAQALLTKLLKKHKMTLDDLNENKEELFFMKYNNMPFGERLLIQIMWQVTNNHAQGTYQKKTLAVMAKKSQQIEIAYRYEIYCEHLKKELELFYASYINANKIFGKTEGNSKNSSNLDVSRVLRMMSSIDIAEVNKAIGSRKIK